MSSKVRNQINPYITHVSSAKPVHRTPQLSEVSFTVPIYPMLLFSDAVAWLQNVYTTTWKDQPQNVYNLIAISLALSIVFISLWIGSVYIKYVVSIACVVSSRRSDVANERFAGATPATPPVETLAPNSTVETVKQSKRKSSIKKATPEPAKPELTVETSEPKKSSAKRSASTKRAPAAVRSASAARTPRGRVAVVEAPKTPRGRAQSKAAAPTAAVREPSAKRSTRSVKK
jgi:hypothetical protein